MKIIGQINNSPFATFIGLLVGVTIVKLLYDRYAQLGVLNGWLQAGVVIMIFFSCVICVEEVMHTDPHVREAYSWYLWQVWSLAILHVLLPMSFTWLSGIVGERGFSTTAHYVLLCRFWTLFLVPILYWFGPMVMRYIAGVGFCDLQEQVQLKRRTGNMSA